MTNDSKIIDSFQKDFIFHIYPNPIDGIIKISTSENSSVIYFNIINPQGQIIKKGELIFNGQSSTLDISSLSKGIYIIELSNKIFVETHKLVLK